MAGSRLPPAARRRSIEDAAIPLFAERGYATTHLTDVAAAAGVTKQLVHRHFATKQELHLALLARHRDGLVAQIAAGAGRADTLEARLRISADAWFGYVEAHPYASRLLFRDTTGVAEIAAFHVTMQGNARAATVATLRAEPELGLAEAQLEPVAELVRSAMVGLALWWADHPDVARGQVVELALAFVLAGARGAAGPPAR